MARLDYTRKGHAITVDLLSYNPLAGDLCSEGHDVTTAERRTKCNACHNRRNGYLPRRASKGTER